jgi:hypothetical protein
MFVCMPHSQQTATYIQIRHMRVHGLADGKRCAPVTVCIVGASRRRHMMLVHRLSFKSIRRTDFANVIVICSGVQGVHCL